MCQPKTANSTQSKSRLTWKWIHSMNTYLVSSTISGSILGVNGAFDWIPAGSSAVSSPLVGVSCKRTKQLMTNYLTLLNQ